MTEQQVLDIILSERRACHPRLSELDPRTPEFMAFRRAARRIAQEAMSDQRRAANLSSMVGASITRGRTRL